MGFFEKLKQGLSKTHENIFSKVVKLDYGKSKIDDELLEGVEEILLSSDIGVKTAEIIIENLKNQHLRQWIQECVELCEPARVHLSTGSEEEYQMLCQEMMKTGTLIKLNPEKRPNSFLARSLNPYLLSP